MSRHRDCRRLAAAVMLGGLVAGWPPLALATMDDLAQVDAGLAPTRVSVGGGPVVVPDFQGASTYRPLPVPFVDAQWGQRARLGVIRGLRVNLLAGERLFVGPVVRYTSGREARGAISALDDISGGLAAGGVIRYEAGPVRLRAEVLTSVNGDIAGSEATISAVWRGLAGSQRWIYTVGPSVSWISDNRANGLFGLDADDAAALDVGDHVATAGVSSVRLTGSLTRVITEDWTVTGFLSAGYLQGDAADSPIVEELGRRQQGFAGVIVNRHF